jgi:hypothetical protein
MAATIANTPTSTQKGAPLPLFNEPRFERANQSRFERVRQSSHGAGNNPRNSRRISRFPKINRHKIPCFVTSMTLWQGFTSTTLGGRASSAPINVTSQCYVLLLRTDPNGLADQNEGGPPMGFSRHACREKSPASPAASTKPPKLPDTLSTCLEAPRRLIEISESQCGERAQTNCVPGLKPRLRQTGPALRRRTTDCRVRFR